MNPNENPDLKLVTGDEISEDALAELSNRRRVTGRCRTRTGDLHDVNVQSFPGRTRGAHQPAHGANCAFVN